MFFMILNSTPPRLAPKALIQIFATRKAEGPQPGLSHTKKGLKSSGMIKIFSWNVNGIRACHKNGFLNWVQESGADVIALQEVRATVEQIPKDVLECAGFEKHWFSAQKKGYSGTGILSKLPVLNVVHGLNLEEFDQEGRVITCDLGKLYVVSAYFPNSQEAGARIDYKVRFCKSLHKWCDELRTKKPVVLTGDFNIAHQPIDLARPKENEGTAGYLPQEREWMSHFLTNGWVDTFRHLHPELRDAYSWWSMRMRARERNVGWRIDYHCVHQKDTHLICGAAIHSQVTGSDHCPVSLDLDL